MSYVLDQVAALCVDVNRTGAIVNTHTHSLAYLTRQLVSAHRWMDRVYAAHIASNGQLSGAYAAAGRRLAVAERNARAAGYAPQEIVTWSTELQEWRVTPAAIAGIQAGE
jgi:hypothetical protein